MPWHSSKKVAGSIPSLHVLPVSASVLSRFSGFLPELQDRQRHISELKLSHLSGRSIRVIKQLANSQSVTAKAVATVLEPWRSPVLASLLVIRDRDESFISQHCPFRPQWALSYKSLCSPELLSIFSQTTSSVCDKKKGKKKKRRKEPQVRDL